MYIHTHTHICMYACMYVHMYICMYVCVYIYVYIHIYIHVHICMYVCMYVCTINRGPEFELLLNHPVRGILPVSLSLTSRRSILNILSLKKSLSLPVLLLLFYFILLLNLGCIYYQLFC